MEYNILEARVEFDHCRIMRITVLVEISPNDVRAITALDRPLSGNCMILPTDTISDVLLQKVAGYGRQVYDVDELFPGWRAKYEAA